MKIICSATRKRFFNKPVFCLLLILFQFMCLDNLNSQDRSDWFEFYLPWDDSSKSITNENSLFNGWYGWHKDYIFPENPKGIGAFYSWELDSLFNAWLTEKYIDQLDQSIAWKGKIENAPEMVINGSFENDFVNWGDYIHLPSGVSRKIEIDDTASVSGNKSARTVIYNPGEESWNLKIKTNEFFVEKDKSYYIRFYARSDTDNHLKFQILKNDTWKYQWPYVYNKILRRANP